MDTAVEGSFPRRGGHDSERDVISRVVCLADTIQLDSGRRHIWVYDVSKHGASLMLVEGICMLLVRFACEIFEGKRKKANTGGEVFILSSFREENEL